jgi:23S rRNA pseudouridine1911/1915/1917 synthase
VYGGRRSRLPAHLAPIAALERPFLHAARLAFTHPSTGAPVAFESPLPPDLEQVLAKLRATRSL